MTNFEIVFVDNGTALLQTATTCHSYEDAQDLVHAVNAIIEGDNPESWDNNNDVERMDASDLGPQDSLQTQNEVIEYAKQGAREQAGEMEQAFYKQFVV